MLLLRFTVKNHKSIRDELVLDMTKRSLRTLSPTGGTNWVDHVYTLGGIFGANASGKSAILDAVHYAFSAISSSATSWQAHTHMLRNPFVLDDNSADEPSRYEIEFVHDERRYLYGFEVDAKGILKEWLREVNSIRWRTLLYRDRETDTIKTHSSLAAIGPVTIRELILSRSILLGHPQLSPIAEDLVARFDQTSVKWAHREQRLASITESLANGTITFEDIVTLLQVADIGVELVDVKEESLPPEVRERLREFVNDITKITEELHRSKKKGENEKSTASVRKLEPEDIQAVMRNLLFTHHGSGKKRPPFLIQSESDGTVAWLALIVPAIEMLRCGGLYCVDEIDSSLHPHLIEALLELFDDPATNPKGAQLLFTSHDSYILSPLSEVELEPEQVWFTEKSNEGATLLTSLADYPRHKDANVAKRYLTGRYGGTPRLAPSALHRLLKTVD